MERNALIEIGSKANIILRFKASTSVNNRNYVANEPFIFIKNANVLISYSNQDKKGTTAKTVIANSEINPRTVTVGNIPFTRKLAALLSTFINEETNYNTTKFVSLAADGTTIYLTDEIDPTDIYVYDANFDLYTDIEYQAGSNSIIRTVGNFVDGTEYIISYSSVRPGTKFNLKKPSIPYMSLEVQGEGNIDKTTKNVIMYFDKVSLNSIVDFTFIQDSVLNVPLSFHIIDNINNYVIYED